MRRADPERYSPTQTHELDIGKAFQQLRRRILYNPSRLLLPKKETETSEVLPKPGALNR